MIGPDREGDRGWWSTLRKIFLVLVASMMLLVNTVGAAEGTSPNQDVERVKKLTVTLGSKSLQAVMADTEPLRVSGLLGWESITDDQGMLLAFDREDQYAIHMQGMKFPIDALWIDTKGKILLIYKSIYPNAGHPFPSFFPSKYCLELKAGFCDRWHVQDGQFVQFLPVDQGNK